MKKLILVLAIILGLGLVWAQGLNNANNTGDEAAENKEAPALNWDAAPVDIVLQAYGEQVNKTILKDPGVPNNTTISIKSREGQKLTHAEYLEAIEVVLEMNGIHLENYGEKFIRAIPRKNARKEGIPLIMDSSRILKDSGRVVSMMISLNNIAAKEAQSALEGFKSDSGQLIVFERTNKILVTDTELNINRMVEIVKSIDIPEVNNNQIVIHQIRYANVSDIVKALETLIDASKEKAGKNNGSANIPANKGTSTPARNTLLGKKGTEAPPVNNESININASDADRGLIKGDVILHPDERSGKIIIVTNQSNHDVFERIIKQLDVDINQDSTVIVRRLKYADAEEVSDMINELLGKATNKSDSKNNKNQNARNSTSSNITRNTTQPAAKTSNPSASSNLNEMTSENTTVLADKRINGLVIRTSKNLVPLIDKIIKEMDVELSQVLIETAIIEVHLDKTIKTGIDWIHKMVSERDGFHGGLSGGGGSASVGGLAKVASGFDVTSAATMLPGAAGIASYMVFDKLNLSMVINASKSDSDSRYLASPIIMTVDNKEATIEATTMKYLLKGYAQTSSYYGTATPDYEQKQLGITVKVTPKINPNGKVMLTVEEEFSAEAGSQTIETALSSGSSESKVQTVTVPTTTTRKMSADISLENGQTAILGGLTMTDLSDVETGIPILKDIPFIGKFLFGTTEKEESRSELIVFMTPYVLKDAAAAEAEAMRRKESLVTDKPWENRGWSKSKVADQVDEEDALKQLRRSWEVADEAHATELKLEEARKARVDELESKAKKE